MTETSSVPRSKRLVYAAADCASDLRSVRNLIKMTPMKLERLIFRDRFLRGLLSPNEEKQGSLMTGNYELRQYSGERHLWKTVSLSVCFSVCLPQ